MSGEGNVVVGLRCRVRVANSDWTGSVYPGPLWPIYPCDLTPGVFTALYALPPTPI